MIIEFVDLADMSEPGEPNKLILIHIDLEYDLQTDFQNMKEQLTELLPHFNVVLVPGGEPCPRNPLPKVTVFNKGNRELMGAIKAIARGNLRPGALVPLTPEQMKALAEAQENGDMHQIGF